MTWKERRDRMMSIISSVNPKMKLRFKDEPNGWSLYNRAVMAVGSAWFSIVGKTSFRSVTTVTRYTILFASRKLWDGNPRTSERILRHELVHIRDRLKHPIWFPFSYLFVLPLLWTCRANWEIRGYTQTMIAEWETNGIVSLETVDKIADALSGSTYFFAGRRAAVYAKILDIGLAINSGAIRRDEFYPHDVPDGMSPVYKDPQSE